MGVSLSQEASLTGHSQCTVVSFHCLTIEVIVIVYTTEVFFETPNNLLDKIADTLCIQNLIITSV